jgi:hypothetical protein
MTIPTDTAHQVVFERSAHLLGMTDAEMGSAMGIRPDTVHQLRTGHMRLKAVHLGGSWMCARRC